MAYTPGPWIIMPSFNGVVGNHFVISFGDGDFVGKAYKEDDARLIAASPLLLEVCKAALYRLKEYDYQAMQQTIDKLTAAIAQAEGG